MTAKNDPGVFFAVDGLSRDKLNDIAFETGFRKRKSGKIDPPDFLMYFCLESLQGTVSYNDIAAKIESQTGKNISRQAYQQRMGEQCQLFFQKVLEHVMATKITKKYDTVGDDMSKFERIIVQDSTVIRIPMRLFDVFSGVKNASTAVCNARIQGVYDLISRQFVHFSIDPYSKNDLSVTLDIAVQSGDLILRDRGYFSIKAMKIFKEKGADSLSRYKHKTALFDPLSGEQINLREYLKKRGSMDKIVLAGGKEKFMVRIIAVPCDEEKANIRKMRAKKETKGKNPSKEILDLMSWSIYIITVVDMYISIETIMALYGLRWRIENIFKTWKSNFNFDKVHNVSASQLHVLLRSRLIMITLIYHKLYNPLARMVRTISKKVLSLMQIMRYISRNENSLERLSNIDEISQSAQDAILRYCTYCERKRKNFEQLFSEAFAQC